MTTGASFAMGFDAFHFISMIRVITAIFIGAIISFAWGFISWMVIGWHTPSSFTDPAAVAEVIKENAPDHGVYMLPAHEDAKEQADAITNGPFLYATIRPDTLDKPWSMSNSLFFSFANNLLCSLMIAICVLRIRATRFISRASVGAILGVFAAISMALPRWNWFETPNIHLLASIIDPIAAYTLAGVFIASIIKAPKARRIFS